MKYLIFLLMSFSSFSFASDALFKSEIIGKWTIGTSDEYFGKEWSTTQYFENGTALYKQFDSEECINPVLIINGAWSIVSGKLINTVLSSDGEFDVPAGIVLVDTIVELDAGKMVLTTDTNRTAYRVKHDTCL